jgi:pimeloyl-ACP methyl ester carboxylesterase
MRGARSMTEMSLPVEVGTHVIQVAGTPTAVRRRGSGRPLLFLHGASFTGRWLPFHEELARDADLIAPDHIGFGATPFQEWLEGFDDLVLHYEEFRKYHGVEQFDLVGYALGGWIAAEYATFYPERIRRLVLIAPGGLRLNGKPGLDLMAMDVAQRVSALFRDTSGFEHLLPNIDDADEVVHLYAEARTVARLTWNPRYNPKLKRRLKRIASPTLIIGAEHDAVVPKEMCDLYAESIPNVRVEQVPGAGHALIAEQPVKVARLILDFLGESQ